MALSTLYGVIMAGGRGTRFWPVSRERLPKQLVTLLGPETLLERTVERLKPLIPPERLLIVTGADHARTIRRHLPDIPRKNVLAEPEGRNTAPCIGLAACEIARREDGAAMGVFPADHLIAKEGEFRKLVKGAAQLLRSRPEALITFGMEPTHPATGYGYIKRGPEVARAQGYTVYDVESFVEKPDLATARRYVKNPRYLWNGGVFFWRVETLRAAFETHLPEMAKGLEAIDGILGRRDASKQLKAIYPRLPAVSIDYGIMERAETVLVIPCDVGWSDVGSWKSLADVLEVDDDGNVVVGRHLGLESSGNVVFAPRHLVATVGLEDLIIVATDDVVLVCPKDRDQDVRRLVEDLKARGLSRYL
ncbi:MAG: mannose-1-phosphate guanylyltransferase [bacterium]|nr:mannose-1-phosphate guanylyltransferase [bacterium]